MEEASEYSSSGTSNLVGDISVKLTRFEVHGFKSIKDTIIDDIGVFTTFVGKNNSGKSNILDAIEYFFLDLDTALTQGSQLSNRILRRVGTEFDWSVTFSATVKMNEYEISEQIGRIEYIPKLIDKIGKGPHVLTICRELKFAERGPGPEWTTKLFRIDSMDMIQNGVGQVIFANDDGKPEKPLVRAGISHDEITVKTVDAILKYLSRCCMRTGRPIVMEPGKPDYVRPKKPAKVDGLRNQLSREDVTDHMRKWQKDMDDISKSRLQDVYTKLSGHKISEWGEAVRVEDTGYEPPLDAIGNGVQHLLDLSFDLMKKTPIILIEEPERHLHPEKIRHVSDSLLSYCLEHDVQMFVTTHSPTFLNSKTLNDIWVTRKTDDGTSCQRVKSSEDLIIASTELGVRVNDVCLSEAILFVEGPADTIVLRKWFEILGCHLEWPSVYVVEMNGKDERHHNAKTWKPVVDAFPPVKMGWIFDADFSVSDKTKFERIIVPPHKVWRLEDGDIEDYYPISKLKNGIKNLGRMTDSQKSKIGALKRSERLVSQIDAILGKDESWKVKTAQYYAQRCKSIPAKIKPLIIEMKDILFDR